MIETRIKLQNENENGEDGGDAVEWIEESDRTHVEAIEWIEKAEDDVEKK